MIGGGGAGLAAALQALKHGASVPAIEAGDKPGGSTSLSGERGNVQRTIGIMDVTPAAAFQYYMTLNQFRLEPVPVQRWCEDAPVVLEWLLGVGDEFPLDGPHPGGIDPIPREHTPVGNGAAIIEALEAALQGRADVALRPRIRRLLVEGGRVVGVEDGTAVRSNAVIICSGGFGANPELLARYYTDAAAHGDWTWYIGSEHAQGDHLALAAAVDAEITGHNRGLLLTTEALDEFIRDRKILTADTIEELARVAGIRFRALQATLERYNKDCEAAAGVLGDRIFGGSTSMVHVLSLGRTAGKNTALSDRKNEELPH